MSEEPRECPFCDSKAHIDNERGLWTVGCFKDDCTRGGAFFQGQTRDETVVRWNRRAPTGKKPETILRPLLDFTIKGQCNCLTCLRIRRDHAASRVKEPSK